MRAIRVRPATSRVITTLLAIGLAWVSPPKAAAQLPVGSLVVTMTSPASGSTVGGTVTVAASVTIVGGLVARGVQFKLDGANLGAEDTTAPYSIPWDSRTVGNGPHTLVAVARDLLGVTYSSSPVTVTVLNDTTPPSVTLTSPASGAAVAGTIAISASATDNVGVVGVQFKVDGANFGAEDTTAPYSVPWNTATAASGAHTVTAVARDAAGNATTSAAVSVTVDNVAPTVAMTAPSGGTVAGTIAVSANASDNLAVAGVQFKLDGANLGAEDTAAPFSVSWNTTTAASGAHTVTAVARDAAGNVTTSAAVSVTVDNVAPTVAMTAPASGTVAGTITVSANASDNQAVAGVQFKLDGANLGAEDTSAPYSTSWNTTGASGGSHTLTAVARDAAGNVTTSGSVAVTVDNTAPTIALTAPQNGATVNGTVTVTANASDGGGVAGVQFKLDGANLGAEDTSAPYSTSWNTTGASGGSHTLTAVARDAAGNVTTSGSVAVTVDNTAPTIALTAPQNGATVNGTVTVTATASDSGGVAGVQFKLDGANLGAEDTSAPYSTSWNTTGASSGSHTLTAVARDAAGNLTTSSAVAVTVDNAALTVTMTAPQNGATVGATVAVTASASGSGGIAGVQFKLDGANLGAEDTVAPYAIDWNTTTATNGAHSIAATARDTGGNTATAAAITVTVNNATQTVTRIEDSSASITYAGFWVLGNTSKPWSGGTAALANGGPTATGDPTRATLTFNGTAVSWIGFKGPQTGIAKVYVDGALAATVDCYNATEVVGAVLYSATGLTPAPHTVAIESTGTRNPASSDIFVVADAFDVTTQGGQDTTPPAVSITSPGAGMTLSGTVAIAANATDNSAVAGVQFKLDGANLGAEDTAAPYSLDWNTATTNDGSHTLTAVARDSAGNMATSAAVVVTVSNGGGSSSSAMTRTENPDVAIIYTPGSAASAPPNWWHGSRSRGWSAETASFNRSDGARATFTFTGTSVAWLGFRSNWAGIGRVYLDGALAGEIDLYSPTEQPQARVFSATGLAPGQHTIVVEATGARNASATDNAVVVDAFDVGPATPAPVRGTRIEDTAAAMTYTAGWGPADSSPGWSGGRAAASTTTGAQATVSFVGTAASLIGFRGPRTGIMRVYLDGSLHATLDTYSPVEVHGVIFTENNLAPGNHQMSIEVTGLKNAAATDALIAVDAFDVRSRFEDVDAAVVYSGTWTANYEDAWSGTSPNYGAGTAARSSTAGARATFSFSGTTVSWIGYRGPQTGIARIYVDGVFAADVDTYATVKQLQAPLFTTSGLAPGPHTLAVEVTGTKNAASSSALILVDAFDVVLSPTSNVTRFQQSAATFPTGVWQQSSTNPYYTGGTVAFSSTVGARAEFTFTGRGIRWIGQRGFDTGIARVYLDGALIGDIDTYAGVQEEYQAAIYSTTGLPSGTHVLQIEVTGNKNASASGTRILVDGFEVIQ